MRRAALAAAFVAATGLAGVRTADADQRAPASTQIQVTGVAVVTVVPDQATVPVTVTSAEETLIAAASRTEREVERLMAFIRASGVAEKDVRGDAMRMVPKRRPAANAAAGAGRPGEPNGPRPLEGEGFEASSQIQVRFTDLNKAAQFAAAARDNGASVVNPTRYSVADPARGADKAREAAFKAARRKAERLAGIAGLKLGRVTRITMPTRDFLASAAGLARPADDGPQTDDVVRIEADVPKGVKGVEVRATLDVDWEAQ